MLSGAECQQDVSRRCLREGLSDAGDGRRQQCGDAMGPAVRHLVSQSVSCRFRRPLRQLCVLTAQNDARSRRAAIKL